MHIQKFGKAQFYIKMFCYIQSFCVKMVSIDERICCNYHIKYPQKSVLVKNDYMQISG